MLVSAVGPTDWAHLPLLRAMHGADFLQLGLVRLPPLGGLWALHSLLGYMAKVHGSRPKGGQGGGCMPEQLDGKGGRFAP